MVATTLVDVSVGARKTVSTSIPTIVEPAVRCIRRLLGFHPQTISAEGYKYVAVKKNQQVDKCNYSLDRYASFLLLLLLVAAGVYPGTEPFRDGRLGAAQAQMPVAGPGFLHLAPLLGPFRGRPRPHSLLRTQAPLDGAAPGGDVGVRAELENLAALGAPAPAPRPRAGPAGSASPPSASAVI